jgi:hypothetical protein
MVADFLKEWISGFEKASILSRDAQIGIHESAPPPKKKHLLNLSNPTLSH